MVKFEMVEKAGVLEAYFIVHDKIGHAGLSPLGDKIPGVFRGHWPMDTWLGPSMAYNLAIQVETI